MCMSHTPRLLVAGALALWLAGTSAALADVKMPPIFGNHMMLQQDAKIPVWGTAQPGEAVKVAIGATHAETTAGPDGRWRVNLAPLPASAAPATLNVTGSNTISIQDVLVGEVWLASGQSNMSFALAWALNGKEALARADNPQIRLFKVYNRTAIRPNNELEGRWEVSTPKTAAYTCAVAYLFAQRLQQTLHRPVGLIQASWGGSAIESWTSLDALKTIPERAEGVARVKQEAAAFPRDPAGQAAVMADYQARVDAWQKTFELPFEAATKTWQTAKAAALAAGKPVPRAPDHPGNRPRNPNGEGGEYSTIFNAMIYPVIPYAIRGALWYQGEANTGRGYDALLGTLISDWRSRWQQGDFPFLVVGLANIGDRSPTPLEDGWAEVRGAQAAITGTMPNTALAEAIDVGTAHNIHPGDKADVAKRLETAALRVAYGRDVVGGGPRFAGLSVEGGKIRITYKDTGSGLTLAVSPYVSPNENPALPTTEPLGFDIAGADHKWVRAQAKIDGNDVLVSSGRVPAPVAVRYAWAQNPEVNLYNKEGFPAVPFRTADWLPPQSTPSGAASNQPGQQKDWAQLQKYHDADAKLGSPAHGENRIVFFGDSITESWKGADFFPGRNYVNRGISGQTTTQMLVRFPQDVIELHPAVVTILAGTNDIAQNQGPITLEAIEANLESMV